MQVDQVPGHFRHQVDGETNLSCPVCLVEAENSNVIEVSRAVRPDSSTGLQERIHRLEQIVEDLANANYYQSESCREDEQYSAYPQTDASPPTHPATGDVNPASFRETGTADITDSIGRININERGTSYVGPAHWQEVVNEISDIKDQLEGFSDTSGDGLGSNSAKPELLLGLRRHVSKQDILRSIPPKQTADSLISYFFEAMELATCTFLPSGQFRKLTMIVTVHRPTFEKEVRQSISGARVHH
ncbi:hypothetical protein DTO271D3_4608 [Paecilomyces variotii]|nr:hypothetical protein DTO169C6_7069 [Paecilomyces variotii]KAJ9315155.1 hypothetical protein DTO271D3_4608 [Paecilomyces variotii]